jgi:rhomboid protease GluP
MKTATKAAMFRKSTGAILCPRCGRLTHPEAVECLVCGLKRPGRWQWASGLARMIRAGSFTGLVTVACIALYVLSLVIDPAAALQPRGPFDLFSPGGRALDWLGMTGAYAWDQGRWWTLLTAIYLHGSLLHILFNVLWIRQLGPAVEELYGPARLVIIFTVAGVAGFAVSNVMSSHPTVGASGAIFGLLGAMVAYGRRRGGAFGTLVLRQYGQWALVLFILGFFMSGVNNLAHAGGFAGGFAAGLVLSFSERREESAVERALAAGLIALTGFALLMALWTAALG